MRNLTSVDHMPEKQTAPNLQCSTLSFHCTFSVKTTRREPVLTWLG